MKEKKQIITKENDNTQVDGSWEVEKKCPIHFKFEETDGERQVSEIVVDQKGLSGTEAIEQVFGTTDRELITTILISGANAIKNAPLKIRQNALTQAVADLKPRSAAEAKLCVQAHILFNQGMRLIGYANGEDMINQQAHCMKFAIQCLRLHNETFQTLDKLRRGREQKVTVQHQHFNVNDGGKAAIMAGSFQAGAGQNKKNGG